VLTNLMLLPLAICAVCIVTSIIGTFAVRLGKNGSIMGALYQGLIVTGVLSAIALYFLIPALVTEPLTVGTKTFGSMALFGCAMAGLVITALIVMITEYYTGTNFRPVKSVAQASVSGHGTNVIQGLAMSLESTAAPAIVIIVGIIVTYNLAGLFGIAIATTAMLSLAGFVVALDAFGPVTDNAGGIAEMAGLPPEVRVTTDALDAVGNTTKAVTKGYAIGSAGLGALVLFAAYTEDLKHFVGHGDAGLLLRRHGSGHLRPVQPLCRGRPAVRGAAALPVRRHVDDGGRPGGSVGGGRGPSSVPREPRHHDGRGEAGIRPRRGHPDQGGDQGNDRALLLPVVSPVVLFFVINAIAGKVDGFRPSAPC
jgi:K(+)-stimulated pyrophosphate-energized sodium pump